MADISSGARRAVKLIPMCNEPAPEHSTLDESPPTGAIRRHNVTLEAATGRLGRDGEDDSGRPRS
jgi:hypothetical protein